MEPLVQVRGLDKTYRQGRVEVRAVRGVSLEVRPGEVVLVMGPSGSGKTTLVSMIGCLLRPTAGSIRIGGQEVAGLGEAQLPAVRRRWIGFVFQTFNLFTSLTARENVEVAFNLRGVTGPEAARRSAEILAQVGLAGRAEFPSADLSGGEKQRVSIARALAGDPPLLLADEPTANLDAATGRAVVSRMTSLAREKGKAVVLVTHDPRVTEFADRVLTMEDGALVAGPAREASA
ncbi:MAG: ABC transporter ATP-binding protein [Planctomycetes bacterium]|nr:ABC transporter ATP-binding protein [Planctomycetota bacterium]